MKMVGDVTPSVLVAITLSLPTLVVSPPPRPPKHKDPEITGFLGSDVITAYELPYVCSIHYTEDFFPVGTCSILTARVVLTTMETMDFSSVESVDDLVRRRKVDHDFIPTLFNHYEKAKLNLKNFRLMTVVAGKGFLKPPPEAQDSMTYTQYAKIDHHHIIDTDSEAYQHYTYTNDKLSKVTTDVRNNTMQDFDFFSFQYNLVFLTLQKDLKWTLQVLPVPIIPEFTDDWKLMRRKTQEFQTTMNTMEVNQYADKFAPGQYCTVGAWGFRTDQPLTFKEVMYVPKTFCQTSYCNYEPSVCLEYPKEIDLCYASTTYGDVCDFEQGSALYCDYFNTSIIGFVKKSLFCGFKNIPAVYTPTWLVIQAFFDIFSKSAWDPRPDWKEFEIIPTTNAPGKP